MTMTTSTSLTEIVQSVSIQRLLVDTARANTNIAQFARVANNTSGQGPAASFPQFVADTPDVVTTEGTTTLTANELETTQLTAITAGVVGLLREVTDFADATNVFGQGAIENYIVNDASAALAVNLDNDLAALFSGFTSSAGVSGVDFGLTVFIQAAATLDGTFAKGSKVAVLDAQQMLDLKTDLATTGAELYGTAGAQTIMNSLNGNTGYGGQLHGIDIWTSTLTDTTNTGADVVGWMGIDPASNEGAASLAIVLVWLPRAKIQDNLTGVSQLIQTTVSYGVGKCSQYACKIVTDA